MIVVLVTLAAGALGAGLRFVVARVFPSPWAVLLVNAVGSGLGGLIYGLAVVGNLGDDALLVLLGGFCGGLTTFSAFGVETVQLVLAGRGKLAALSVVANLVLGIGAAALAFGAVMLIH